MVYTIEYEKEERKMASYSLKISSHYRFVLLKTDKHGTHYTTHQIVNHGGRWIADGRYDVTNLINQPNGANMIAATVGAHDYYEED